MGRLIHTNDLHNAVMMNKHDWGIFDVTIDNLIEGVVSQVPTVEAVPKDQYEARLKADMVAMLEDLDLLIDEYDSGCGWDGYIKKIDAHALITRKINALKGDTK